MNATKGSGAAPPGGGRQGGKPSTGERFDEENATSKSGRWGSEEPSYGDREPSRAHDSKHPNPQGPEYEEGGAYPGRSYGRGPEHSPESMHRPDSLAKPDTHEAGKQAPPDRTVGNHPADPNRVGAKWNLLPPGISDEDARNPGGMKDEKDEPGGRKR